MFVESWVIGENTDGVVIDFKSFVDRFDDDTNAVDIGDFPVKIRSGKLVAKIEIAEVEIGEKSFDFTDSGALTENPR